MRTYVDRRVMEFERDDPALRRLDEGREAWLSGELDRARLFCRIDRKAAFLAVGASSIEDLAARRGYDGPRAARLRDLGYALAALPGLEPALRACEVSFVGALAIAPLFRFPETFLEEGDDWLRAARTLRHRDLTRLVRRRIESARQGRPVTRTWSAEVSRQTHDDLRRCREVAVRKAGHGLTRGQLLALLAQNFRLDFDPRAIEGRPRRAPDTSERPDDRHVPREVTRAILARSGGWCEFGDCPRTATEHCHLKPHRHGSGREVNDLVDGCAAHHKAYDAGTLRFLGWSVDGHPTFRVPATGEVLVPRRALPDPPEDAWPEWMDRVLGAKAGRWRRIQARRAAATAAGATHGSSDGEGPRASKRPGAAPPPSRPPPGHPPDGDVARDAARDAVHGAVHGAVHDLRAPAPRRPGRIAPYRPRVEDPGHDLLR